MSDALLADLREHVDALLGEVIETTPSAGAMPSIDGYRGRPVAFLREVLGMSLLAWQVAWLEGPFAESALNVILSCNGAGKTGLMSALLVYLAAVGQSTAIYYSASEKQTRSQMTVELRRRLRETHLATTIYNHGCAFAGGGAILLLAVGEANSLQGFHGNVTIIADEAQALDGEALGAFMGCIVGDETDRLILCGNALGLGTTFHQITQNRDALWRQTVVTAPEIIADPEAAHIPGLITKKGVDQLRQTFGQEHWQFQARVYARFARHGADAMFPEAEVLAAFDRWHDPAFKTSQQRKTLMIGVDVGASTDGDESVVAVARGGYVYQLDAFREQNTMRTVGIVIALLKRLSVRRETPNLAGEIALWERGLGHLVPAAWGDPIEVYGSNPAVIRVDEAGVGKGVGDRLRESGYGCEPFIASRRPESADDGERYANVRAEAAARLRDLLVRGTVALPPDDLLREELLSCQQVITSTGKLQIWSKKEWRNVLGRSPDRLDAVILAVAATGVIDFTTAASEAGLAVVF